MAIWPKCPNCGAEAKSGALFVFRYVPDATHFECLGCEDVFPLWNLDYTMNAFMDKEDWFFPPHLGVNPHKE